MKLREFVIVAVIIVLGVLSVGVSAQMQSDAQAERFEQIVVRLERISGLAAAAAKAQSCTNAIPLTENGRNELAVQECYERFGLSYTTSAEAA